MSVWFNVLMPCRIHLIRCRVDHVTLYPIIAAKYSTFRPVPQATFALYICYESLVLRHYNYMSRGRRSRNKRQSLKEGIVPFE